MASDPSGDERERERRLERLLPELLKRLVEVGYDRLSEGPENVKTFVNELKLPKETLQHLRSYLEDTRGQLSGVIAKEVREFLQRSSLSEELVKVLARLTLQVKTEVRFVRNDGKISPSVHSEYEVTPNSEADAKRSQVREEEESAKASRRR